MGVGGNEGRTETVNLGLRLRELGRGMGRTSVFLAGYDNVIFVGQSSLLLLLSQ